MNSEQGLCQIEGEGIGRGILLTLDIVTSNILTMIYHYTQLRNLDKIIQKESVVFRMYDSRWLNDPSESKILQEYILKYQDDIISNLNEKYGKLLKSAIQVSSHFTPSKILPSFFYVLSFSSIGDSNIFWGSKYSGLNGFSLTINESGLINDRLKKIGRCIAEDVYYFNSIEGSAVKEDIEHVSKKIEDLFLNILSESQGISDEDLPFALWNGIISFLSIFHKHPSWAHEKERRFVIITRSKSSYIGVNFKGILDYFPSGIGKDGYNIYCEESKIDFENNLFPRPYIEIELLKDSISHITLGPNLSENDLEAVKNYLYYNNYAKIKVLPSGAQIR